jgi:uncharacterized membrane protein
MSDAQLPVQTAVVGSGLIPTQDERTMATLAHVLQLVGWWIAPLVIFLVKRESRFVSFHALQALLLQIVHVIVMVVFMIGWFVLIFSTVILHPAGKNDPPPAIFLVFPLVWLGIMGLWLVMVILAIVYGIKAGRGEWAEYPVLGSLARKMLKMGPNGEALDPAV